MAINVYLIFNGNCREAVEFYAQVFGAEKQPIMTFGEMPPDPEFTLPEEAKNLVLHTYLTINDSMVMFSDTFPGMPFVTGNNISLTINMKNTDDIRRLFNELKEGGTIDMELQETFWSKCYGMLTDKFGIPWQFNFDSGEAGM